MALFLLFIASMIATAYLVNVFVAGSELRKWEKKFYGIDSLEECKVYEYTPTDRQD